MALEVQINGSSQRESRYVTFAPSNCRIRQNPASAELPVKLTSRQSTTTGGEIVFFTSPTSASEMTLDLVLPADGEWVEFWIGGKWGSPSTDDQDCMLVADDGSNETTISLMVRVRKNANNLSDGERDRFLNAFKIVNNAGNGVFQDFRDMHVDIADDEEHGGPHFLPWHRAYLVDLERQLQLVDPSVALHYWRFDEPANNLFTADFMGVTQQVAEGRPGQMVSFPLGHALSGWTTDSQPGISRSAYFDTLTQAAPGLQILANFPLRNQQATLALGNDFSAFQIMERSPHGAAHVSFGGFISQIQTAAKDPLFFMLHCNVDRLWALWQWLNNRVTASDIQSYTEQNRDGRRLDDTLWPWNDIIGNNTPATPRPPFAPRGQSGLTPSDVVSAPDPKPVLRSTIDSNGHVAGLNNFGFGYDDVPFEGLGGLTP